MHVLVALAEILGHGLEADDILLAEVVCVFDALVYNVSDIDEVFGAEVGGVLHLVGDGVRDLAVLHLLEDEVDVCEGAEERSESLHVLCV